MMHGQTRVEFIFAVIIFLVIIFYMVNQMNTISSSIISDYNINNMKAEANSVMETLTNDKGYPENWVDFLNQGWQKRRVMDITGGSNELTNQQIRINITYDNDMKSDFSDLRFADSDKVNNIPYWIENKSDGKWVMVWLKIHKIPESGKKSIYMYYNYSSATSESNGNNVFIQFLDLSGSSLPPGWVRTDMGTSGTATVSNGLLRLTNANGIDVWEYNYEATQFLKKSTVSGNFVAVAKVNGLNDTSDWAKAGIIAQNFVREKNYNGMAMMSTTPSSRSEGHDFSWQTRYDTIAPDTENYTGVSVIYPTYIKLVRSNSYFSGWYSKNGSAWTQLGSYKSPIALEDLQYVSLFVTPHDESAQGLIIEANFSMFYVYRYASPEPTGAVGSEETRTNESWFPIKEVGLADQPNILSADKIADLSANCDLLLNFGMNTYRLRIYNSTSLLLYCGTESLSPAKITVSRYVKIGNDLGNITLEMW
jgi:hypothetical protein